MKRHWHNILGWIALLCFGALIGCSEIAYESIIVNQHFSLEIPDYLELQENMHADAPLQRGNVYESTYLIGRYDSLPAGVIDLEAYYLNTFQQILPGAPVPYPDTIQVDGKLALHIQTAGSHSNRALIYDLTLIQGESFLYQILSWTEEKEAPKYLDDMEKIWKSFREL
ncbi:MAG: hypothetical protein AB8H47_30325 [Bacteroidia bacterium]